MALTVRTNGTGASNLVNSSWWNDYYTLLTGGMADQPVSLVSNLTMKASLSTAATGTQTTGLNSSGALGVGVYQYCYTWAMADGGESLPSAPVSATTTSGSKSLTYGNIQTGPTGTTKRNIYRTQVGGSIFYYLASVNNNTASTYFDSAADSALTTTITAPLHSTFGGSIFFKDTSGTTHLTIAPDGSFIGAGGTTTLGNTTISNTLTLGNNGSISFKDSGGTARLLMTLLAADNDAHVYATPANGNFKISKSDASGDIAIFNNSKITFLMDLYTTGKVSVSAVGDVLDGGGFDTYVSARGGLGNLVHLRGGTTDLLTVGTSELFIYSQSIRTNGAYIGFKKQNGTKLAEMTSGGNFIAAGGIYTAAGTYTTGSSATFDSFDIAETYQVDAEYPSGTVVCPADTTTVIPYSTATEPVMPTLTKCTHDACNLASILVSTPGFCMGLPNVPSLETYDSNQIMTQPAALAGRIFAKTAYNMTANMYVTSDGRGGVRSIASGESAFALGIVLSPSSSAMVPILVRPMFVKAP